MRDLEAARRLADGGKATGCSCSPVPRRPDGDPEAVAAAVAAGAPQLDPGERDELAAWLGAITWEDAAPATGLDLAAVPGWPG